MSVRPILVSSLEQLCFRLCAGNSICDDSGAHLEAHYHSSGFGAVVSIDNDATPEHLEPLLKAADRMNVWKRRYC
jgi:hypothetical protein